MVLKLRDHSAPVMFVMLCCYPRLLPPLGVPAVLLAFLPPPNYVRALPCFMQESVDIALLPILSVDWGFCAELWPLYVGTAPLRPFPHHPSPSSGRGRSKWRSSREEGGSSEQGFSVCGLQALCLSTCLSQHLRQLSRVSTAVPAPPSTLCLDHSSSPFCDSSLSQKPILRGD